MKRAISLSIVFATLAWAQPEDVVISPQAIVVNPNPAYSVEVWVDRDPTGEGIPTYAVGGTIRLGVRVAEASYVYLFNVRSDGEIRQIMPNRVDERSQDNFMRAGETRTFPPEGARYSFSVAPPTGLDKVLAVASKQPLDTATLARFEREGEAFAVGRMGQEEFARALSIIVEPLPSQDWVTDTALFYVVQTGQAAPAPIYGTLEIRSEPQGALAYVDGQFVGTTPVRYGTREGVHEVRLEREGYEIYRTEVRVPGGDTVAVDTALSPVRRTGTVNFTSQPGGAEVFLDGRRIGTTPITGFALDEDSYQVRFSLPGYQDQIMTIQVQRDRTQTFEGDLRPQQGSLSIQSNVGGARVFINGNQFGTIPTGTGRITFDDLPVGRHELAVVAPGYATVVQEFEIRPGETTEVRISQTRR